MDMTLHSRVRLPSQSDLLVMGIAAHPGSGKTTLLRALIPMLKARGLRTGVIKRARPDFDIDKPGTDSYELRKAGAAQVLISSPRRWALMAERESAAELTLPEAVAQFDAEDIDLVLVEGCKCGPIAKIEVYRPSLGRQLIARNDPHVVAVATDEPEAVDVDVPVLDLNRPEEVVEFICDRVTRLKQAFRHPDDWN